jgi:hypothetical protein
MAYKFLPSLALPCAMALVLVGTPAALSEDKELAEATEFTGTFMFLGANVPGLLFGAVRNGETALAGFGKTAKGSKTKSNGDSIFGSLPSAKCSAAPYSAHWHLMARSS